jgi:hypothetical protein
MLNNFPVKLGKKDVAKKLARDNLYSILVPEQNWIQKDLRSFIPSWQRDYFYLRGQGLIFTASDLGAICAVCQKLPDCNTPGRLSARNAKNNHTILLVRISIRAATRSIIEMKNDFPVMLSGRHRSFFSTIRANTFRSMPHSGHV